MVSQSEALRDRIKTVKKTKKITEAMRLVAAAKVRRAQMLFLLRSYIRFEEAGLELLLP